MKTLSLKPNQNKYQLIYHALTQSCSLQVMSPTEEKYIGTQCSKKFTWQTHPSRIFKAAGDKER